MFYILIFFITLIFSLGVDFSRRKDVREASFILVVLFLSVIGGMRDLGVGADTLVYSESSYYAAKELNGVKDFFTSERDKGYLLINVIAVWIGDLHMAHFIGQLITNGLILYAGFLLKCKYKPIVFTAFVFVYLFVFYNQTYNFMRQYCAIAFVLVAFYYMLCERWWLMSLFIALSISFHLSAFLSCIIPIYYYFCVVCKSDKMKWFSLLGSLLLFVVTYQFYMVLDNLTSYGFVDETYQNRYGEDGQWGEGRSRLRPTFIFLFFAVLYLVYVANQRKILKSRFCFFWGALQITYIAITMLSFVASQLYRLGLYFYLPTLMLASFVIMTKKIRIIERLIFFSVIVLDWFIYVYLHNNAETIPYKSAVLGI